MAKTATARMSTVQLGGTSSYSLKRERDSSFEPGSSNINEYARVLHLHDILSCHDILPSGLITGRVVSTSLLDKNLTVEVASNEGLSVTARFAGDFALRLNREVEVDANIFLSTRGAVVESGQPIVLEYDNGVDIDIYIGKSIVKRLKLWEGTPEQSPKKRARRSLLSDVTHSVSATDDEDNWMLTPRPPSRQANSLRGSSPDDLSLTLPLWGPQITSTPRAITPSQPLSAHLTAGADLQSPHTTTEGTPRIAMEKDEHKDEEGGSSLSGMDNLSTPSAYSSKMQDAAERPLGKRKKRKGKQNKAEASTSFAPSPLFEGVSPPVAQQSVETGNQTGANAVNPSVSSTDSYFDSVIQSGIFRADTRHYTPLAQLALAYRESLIGLVSYAAGKAKSNRGRRDWGLTVHIVDPSNLDAFGGWLYRDSPGIVVTMFNAYETWLPELECGDVLILSEVKASKQYGKMSITGYSDQFKWAAFRRNSRKFDNSDLQGAPGSRQVQDKGKDQIYSPFLPVGPQEAGYCGKLLDWWDEVQQKRKDQAGPVQFIGDDPISPAIARNPRRCHQLVQDVDFSGGGYFDCTVEVLHVNHVNEMAFVYATDYTSNTKGLGLRPVSADWCPRNLRTKTLQIEFYGVEGSNFVRDSKIDKGQIWSIANVRLKEGNSDRYLEAAFSETRKARQLAEKDLENNAHYQQLLARKAEFQESNSSPYESKHTTLNEAVIDNSDICLFTCTVEILRITKGTQQGGLLTLYVTDFTTRPDLVAPTSSYLKEHYPNAVLGIELEGFQAEYAGQLCEADFVKIQNVRAKKGLDGVCAKIGGHDILIRKLAAESQDPQLVKLLERKNGWQLTPTRSTPRAESEERHVRVPPTFKQHRSAPGIISEYLTVRQILDHDQCPAKFRLKAYVIDYDPLDLAESIIRLCHECDETADIDDQRCKKCGTGVENLGFQLDIHLELADEPLEVGGGSRLYVEVCAPWEVLAGIDPETLVHEGEVENVMKDRLRPYIEHIGKETADTPGPMFEFVVESTPSSHDDEGEKRSYRIVSTSTPA